MTNKSEKAVSAMNFFEFEHKFPDEKAAIDHFLDIRYQGNLTCPHCGAKVSIYRYRDRPKFFQCSTCQNTFSPFKDTIFEKTHIDMRRWFYAIKMFLNSRKGISGCQLERELGVAYSTAWRMLQQIRIAMKNEKIKTLFKGIVEADVTYDGGKAKKGNAILDKDGNIIGRTKPKNKRGRGTNKTPIFGMKERETGKVRAKVMEPNEKGQKTDR